MDLVQRFPTADTLRLQQILNEKSAWIRQNKKGFIRYRELLQTVQDLRASSCDFSGDVVRIGTPDDLTASQRQRVYKVLRGLMPWRKGPFSVFGVDIDAEWRSERKWNRIVPELPPLAGKVIADIGCNNGYYMFRLAEFGPAFVLGFEPYVHHYYTFQTLNTFARQPNLQIEPLGIEHLGMFSDCFDVIFCLGILYHRASPVDALRDLFFALKPGGWLFVESQAVPGTEPVALFPRHTYAKAPGTWFVPTAACLHNWVTRVGFQEAKIFCEHPMSNNEQRRTSWMNFESFEDFIDNNNPNLTIEGYPAPRRVFLKAKKM
jgi:tRNA (mo5U34)-methyltransferase